MSLLYKVLCDGKTLLDQTKVGFYLTEASITDEINDGIFDAQMDFSLYVDNPNFDAIRPMISTIVVYEIYNGTEREIFRGRPVSIDDSFDPIRKVTCEGEMKFLLDVPNVFGKYANDKRVDIIGNESEMQQETMVPVPKGDTQNPKPMNAGYRNVDDCQLTRFGENRKWQSHVVYRNSVTTNDKAVTGTRVGPGVDQTMDQGRTRFSLYTLHQEDLGLYFYVNYMSDYEGLVGEPVERFYRIPLKTCGYRLTVYGSRGNSFGGIAPGYYFKESSIMDSAALYLGNIQMIGQDNRLFDLGSYRSDEKIDILTSNGEKTGEIDIGDLPFCIVYYPDAQHWTFSHPDMYISTPLLHWSRGFETVIYAVSEGEGAVASKLNTVSICVYKKSSSTVQAVAKEVFCEYGATPIAGFNAYVGEERQIFRGRIDVDGPADKLYTDSCYSSLKKWLDETSGYAKIRVAGGYRVLDILPDSGEMRNDFYVRLGDNLMGASRKHDCTDLATGVYVRGTWNDGLDEVTLQSANTINATTAQDMWDPTASYVYTGDADEVYKQGKCYEYTNDKWTEMEQAAQNPDPVDSPHKMTDITKKYLYTMSGEFHVRPGHVYYIRHGVLTEDTEAKKVTVTGDFEVDYKLGVIWHKTARSTYGSIIFYHEEDLTETADGTRLQRLAEKGQEELRKKLSAFEVFEISAGDPRLISVNGGRPELGNYYLVEIPHLGIGDYKRLTKITTYLFDQDASTMTFGGKSPTLSDYIAKKGERLA